MDFPGPSTYTPLMRRLFGNERQREIDEARQLYARMRAEQDALHETVELVTTMVLTELDPLPDDLRGALATAIHQILAAETHIFELPTPDFERMSMKEFVDFNNFLRAKEYFFANKYPVFQMLYDALTRLFCGLAKELPRTQLPSPFTIPLIYALPNPRLAIDKIFGTIADDRYEQRGIFRIVFHQLYRNLCEASGRIPYEESKKPFINAPENKQPLNEVNDLYLKNTPFHDLLTTPVPLKLTHEDRFTHMHIIGGTGAGKTSLLEHLIFHDMTSDPSPALVLVDSQGDLIRKLSRMDHPALDDRLVLITPSDIAYPPAVNLFDMNRGRLSGYSEAMKEQVVAGVIQTFDYLFAGLLGADLTAKQGVFFRYIARLMLALPETMGRNATIFDMLALMDDPAPYGDAIAALAPIPRAFFMRDFGMKTFVQTREQIRYRLQAIIENPTMARLFTSPSTKVDLFDELNSGSIILIDTAKDFLKGNSAHFGRIFISLVLQAALERAAIPERERNPAFLIVDEAAQYFDQNIDDLLTEARKYRLGCVFAHQYLEQASSSLRASLAANTGIKFAGGVSMNDARALAPDMRTTADFIMEQPRLHFAAHIRHTTPSAVSIPVEPGLFAGMGKLSEAEHNAMLLRNRQRVALEPSENHMSTPRQGHASMPPAQEPSTPVDSGMGTSKEW